MLHHANSGRNDEPYLQIRRITQNVISMTKKRIQIADRDFSV